MTRITTLMPSVDPMTRTVRMPKLNAADKPWTTCRKLGAYLMNGLDDAQVRDVAFTAARWLIGDDAVAYDPEPDGVVAWKVEQAKSKTFTYRNAEGAVALVALGATPKGNLGSRAWWLLSKPMDKVRIVGCRLPVLAGALELIDDRVIGAVNTVIPGHHSVTAREAVMDVIAERRERLASSLAVTAAARLRWPIEERIALNAAWRRRSTAGVFEDKLHCDESHRRAAASSVFARMYRHVEIDDGVDLDLFALLCDEYEMKAGANRLPAISEHNVFRFRLTGRHRAIGLYSPSLRALAVDPRHPESTWHEMSHAWDAEHDMVSSSPSFRPVLEAYASALDTSGMSESQTDYALTPAEVFARVSEWWASKRGFAGSFAPLSFTGPLYAPFETMGDMACAWMDSCPLFERA